MDAVMSGRFWFGMVVGAALYHFWLIRMQKKGA